MDFSGAAATGTVTIDGEEYTFSEDGALADGLVETEDGLRFAKKKTDEEDELWVKEDFKSSGGYVYYFDHEGYAVKGWHEIEGKRYYFNDEYRLENGIFTENGAVYYMSKNGMVTDKWVNTEEGTYYFGGDGKAASGWTTIRRYRFLFQRRR